MSGKNLGHLIGGIPAKNTKIFPNWWWEPQLRRLDSQARERGRIHVPTNDTSVQLPANNAPRVAASSSSTERHFAFPMGQLSREDCRDLFRVVSCIMTRSHSDENPRPAQRLSLCSEWDDAIMSIHCGPKGHHSSYRSVDGDEDGAPCGGTLAPKRMTRLPARRHDPGGFPFFDRGVRCRRWMGQPLGP
jgi:hypothetical protein